MKDDKRDILMRCLFIYIAIFIGFLCILGRILYIQIAEGSFWRTLSKERYEDLREVRAKRGTIYSVDSDSGELLVLATDIPQYDIYMDLGSNPVLDPKTHKTDANRVISDSIYKADMPRLCIKMAYFFAGSPQYKSADEYMAYFSKARNKSKGNRYVLVAKDLSLDQWEIFRKFPLISYEKIRKIGKKRIGTGKFYQSNAVSVVERNVRYYPYYPMARRSIGVPLYGCDTCYDGIDGFYSSYLRGEKGMRKERKINPGVWVPCDETEQIKPIDGNDIISTIDVRLQELADNSLVKCLDSNDAEEGCVILMEVKTGYVRAISSMQLNEKTGEYVESRNLAVNDYFEPGSTFKTITAMMLLDKHLADTAMMLPTFAKRFPGTKKDIVDVGKINHGMVSMGRAIEMSSNVAMSQLAYQNYIQTGKKLQLAQDLEQYFYFHKLDMDIRTNEPTPYINKKATSVDDILRMSFGYVTMMTPLQLLTFYNGIANNGVMVKPRFVSSIVKNGKTIKTFPTTIIKNQMCKKETLLQIQSILKKVVEQGTGKRLSKTAYGIAGKTGTAEVNYVKSNGLALQHRASFAGYFPADNPQYSCIVVIIKPHKNVTHGGDLAAPVFKDLSDRVVGTRVDFHQAQTNVKQVPAYTTGNAANYNRFCTAIGMRTNQQSPLWQPLRKDNIIPNVKGMTIRDAMYLLSKKGLKVHFSGKGKVCSQSPQAGGAYKAGSIINLQLQ